MRVAVLADVHGNLPALEAVLDDIDAVGVDAIVLDGDVATGPCPQKPWTGWPNYAKRPSGYVATPIGSWSPCTTASSIQTCLTRRDHRPSTAHPGWRSDIGTCSPICHLSVAMNVTGLGPVRFCHATTRSDTQNVLVDSPVEGDRQATG